MRPPAFEVGGLGRKSGGRAVSVPVEQAEAAVAVGEGWQTKGLVRERVFSPQCYCNEH